MKRAQQLQIAVFVGMLGCITATPEGFGQIIATDQHTVTIQVSPISTVAIVGGGVNLTLDNASVIAGQDQMVTTDQTTSLSWGTNSSSQKIMVSTSLGSPRYTLKVVVLNPTRGTAAPEVTLSTVAKELLLDIGRTSGTCTLKYTGIALASAGDGTETQTITFTVQAQ